ncbi:hypothetical protein A1O3_09329 [Capronia epimyces CBS 606.96]|uniref:EthD domain-containing protein n=1 Tax=Capronia epimyces CBS 606.96 TaxID=1182542 RepID=W9XD74_9EURO|nr:uncharacterized protein A1O3_09329 [Capronia epimyces CBS 606.96]EXJ78168.1 hypothetical protein A1O3_09329 [Capronia epimyces CBS 606.96]
MAGVQMIIMINKKEGTTDLEFYKYWNEVHGPMFLDKVPLARKYISKYEQYHMNGAERSEIVKQMADAGSVSVDRCDGVSVLSADSLEDLQKVLTSKEFLETVNPDNHVYAGQITSVLLSEGEKVLMYERDADAAATGPR